MGVIFDGTCMLWQDDCGTAGSCMFYDNADLSLGFLFLCSSVSGVSLAAMVAATFCYRAPSTTAMDAVVITVNGSEKSKAGAELSERTLFQTDF